MLRSSFFIQMAGLFGEAVVKLCCFLTSIYGVAPTREEEKSCCTAESFLLEQSPQIVALCQLWHIIHLIGVEHNRNRNFVQKSKFWFPSEDYQKYWHSG